MNWKRVKRFFIKIFLYLIILFITFNVFLFCYIFLLPNLVYVFYKYKFFLILLIFFHFIINLIIEYFTQKNFKIIEKCGSMWVYKIEIANQVYTLNDLFSDFRHVISKNKALLIITILFLWKCKFFIKIYIIYALSCFCIYYFWFFHFLVIFCTNKILKEDFEISLKIEKYNTFDLLYKEIFVLIIFLLPKIFAFFSFYSIITKNRTKKLQILHLLKRNAYYRILGIPFLFIKVYVMFFKILIKPLSTINWKLKNKSHYIKIYWENLKFETPAEINVLFKNILVTARYSKIKRSYTNNIIEQVQKFFALKMFNFATNAKIPIFKLSTAYIAKPHAVVVQHDFKKLLFNRSISNSFKSELSEFATSLTHASSMKFTDVKTKLSYDIAAHDVYQNKLNNQYSFFTFISNNALRNKKPHFFFQDNNIMNDEQANIFAYTIGLKQFNEIIIKKNWDKKYLFQNIIGEKYFYSLNQALHENLLDYKTQKMINEDWELLLVECFDYVNSKLDEKYNIGNKEENESIIKAIISGAIDELYTMNVEKKTIFIVETVGDVEGWNDVKKTLLQQKLLENKYNVYDEQPL